MNKLLRASCQGVWKCRSSLVTKQRTAALAAGANLGSNHGNTNRDGFSLHAAAAAAAVLLTGGGLVTCCDEHFTPASVAREALRDYSKEDVGQDDNLPVFSADEVSANNGEDGCPIYMTYGGIVYDVTDFVANHPGGSEKILQAAGSAIEPFWFEYRQHFASDLPMKLMEHMIVGKLKESDQADIDEQMIVLEEDDPYAKEPLRHHDLIVHSDQPMNAETPGHLLTHNYLTPNSLFYIRNHHPVPFLTEKERKAFKLKIDLTEYGKGVLELSLDELKKLPRTTITATMQCSGNRRRGFNGIERTSGTPWGQGAISTSTFTGVRLLDLLKLAGLEDAMQAENDGMEHVRFHAIDGMSASIGIAKAANPYGDCIVAYEMGGEELARDHGMPLRVIVPGYAAVRNVKWLERIELSREEAEGPWQRGLNYKALPPNVTDVSTLDLSKVPSLTEVSLFSAITNLQVSSDKGVKPGESVKIRCSGWAWAGGGRNITRVDLTGDAGETWSNAQLTMGTDQKPGRAWAWVFWECEVFAKVFRDKNGRLTVNIASKAVDSACNVQPESKNSIWNVRGLGNNAWFRKEVFIPERRGTD